MTSVGRYHPYPDILWRVSGITSYTLVASYPQYTCKNQREVVLVHREVRQISQLGGHQEGMESLK